MTEQKLAEDLATRFREALRAVILRDDGSFSRIPVLYDAPNVEYIPRLKRCWYCGGLNTPEARKCEHCGACTFTVEPPRGILSLGEDGKWIRGI